MTIAAATMPTPFTVVQVLQENYRTKTLILDGQLPASPGQFVMAWLPRFDEKPFSLVNHDPLTLMVTAVGPFSRLLHQLTPGHQLWLRGPFGQGFHWTPDQARIALVGGGYGVAPLLWLAQVAAATGVAHISVVIGARTAADLLYVDRFIALEGTNRATVQVVVTTEDGSRGLHGRVTDYLEPRLAGREYDSLFACGPHPMLAALQALGTRYSVPSQLSWEAYMRCAIGICGACEHAGRVLCLDGPVLAYPA